MYAAIYEIVETQGEISHKELHSITNKYAGSWVLHVPFQDYSDWSGSLQTKEHQ